MNPTPAEVLAQIAAADPGIDSRDLAFRFETTLQGLGDSIEELRLAERIVGFGGFWFTPDSLDRWISSLLGELGGRIERVDRLVSFAAFKRNKKARDRIVQYLVDRLVVRTTPAGIARFTDQFLLERKSQELLNRIKSHLRSDGFDIPPRHKIGDAIGVPPPAAQRVVALAIDAGQLVELAPDLVVPPELLDELRGQMKAKHPPEFTVTEFKDAFGLTRRTAIPFLEFFDTLEVTRRVDANRRLQVEQ